MGSALLAGLKVLDMGVLASGPYCAKLLCDAGADVVHIEHPQGGDPSRALGPFAPEDGEQRLSATFAFLNAGKRSLALDFTEPEGAALLWRLIDWADVLIENFPPGTLARHGFDADQLQQRNPRLVQVSISPYGQTGPYRDFAATELTLQAMAGLLDGNGLAGREPLRYPGFVAQFMAGANAAYAALVAYRHARRSGRGQQIDISAQESVAATYYSLYANYEYLGVLQQRGQKDLYPTADGPFMAIWRTTVPWDIFALAFDALELTLDPALEPPRGLLENKARIDDILAQHLRTQTRRHWFARAREHRIAAGMLQTLDDVFSCPQLAARGSFDELETAAGARAPFPGQPYWVDGGRSATVRTAPRLGEHNRQIIAELERPASLRPTMQPSGSDGQPVLAGVRVLDNGIVEAGTYPTRCLADFGAEIVRVENYPVPDISRNATMPDGEPDEPYWEQGGVYHEQHRNKDHCIGLDLRHQAAREAFLRLCMTCDVVIDSHPPDVMERLGLGPTALRRLKPDLVVITTSGYGYGGPYTATRSYGMMTELMCGLSSLNGYPDGEPRRGTIPITDNESVFHIAFVMMAALEHRDRTGEGAWIDVSQYEVGINVLGDQYVARALGATVPARQGNVDPPYPLSGCYACLGDDEWITVSVQDRAAWLALCDLVGARELADAHDPFSAPLEPPQHERLDRALRAWTGVRSPAGCLSELQARGIAAGAVMDVRDLLLDPHLERRGFFWSVDHHPLQRAGRRAWPGATARLSRTSARLRRHAPLLGEHNSQVLTELLGFDAAQYEALVASGAVGTAPIAAGVRPKGAIGALAYATDPASLERLRERFGAGYGPAYGERGRASASDSDTAAVRVAP